MVETIAVLFILVVTGIIVCAARYECANTNKYHGFGKYKKKSKKAPKAA
jgi:hypothetical protein